MIRLLLLGTLGALAGGALAGCSPSERASTDAGVCWRVVEAQAPAVLDRNIANLETCAARLEAVRLRDGGTVEGLYAGRSIFVSAAAIEAAATRDGARYRVFDEDDRLALQAAIRKLLDREAERGAAARG